MIKKVNMKLQLKIILLIFLVLIAILIMPSKVRAESKPISDVESTLIVKAKDENVFKEYENISSVQEISNGIYCVNYESKEEAENGIKDLNQNILVQNVCKDVKVKMLENTVSALAVSPNDMAWGVNSTGINHYLKKLKGKTNKEKVRVAVLDTGINSNHEAFYTEDGLNKVNFSYSRNYVNSTNDVTDDQGHGTQVAGIIAQSTPENVEILPIKVLDDTGYGKLSNILLAIIDIRDNADIINLSLGIEPSEMDDTDLMICETVFQGTYDLGVVTVCASGNEGRNSVNYPASSEYTMAVSSINKNKQITSFSNYGDEIDFALPGEKLLVPSYKMNPSYTPESGTSFSSPFLSAAIALIKTENHNYSIQNILNVLKRNAEDLGTYGKDKYYGYGSLNFDINMFEKPGIEKIETSRENLKLYVSAYSGNNLVSYAITTSSNTPSSSEWIRFNEYSKDIDFEITVSKYGEYYVWVKNEEGYITSKKISIDIFDDVAQSNWYYGAVKYVYENNIMTGLNKTTFGPNEKLTRGMLATIIHRMEGSPKVTGTVKFTDMKDSSKYYYQAVKWASDHQIVNGYSDGRFGPGDNVTREQLAVILYNYAKYKGKNLNKTDNLESFADSSNVASWAKTAVKWAVGNSVITGSTDKKTGNKLINPKGNATRAEVAAMIQKYCKNVGR